MKARRTHPAGSVVGSIAFLVHILSGLTTLGDEPSRGVSSDLVASIAPAATLETSETAGHNAQRLGADLERQILWTDEPRGHAVFIPERIFEERPLDALPMSPDEREILRQAMERALQPHPNPILRGRPRKACASVYAPSPQGSHPEATSLEALIEAATWSSSDK